MEKESSQPDPQAIDLKSKLPDYKLGFKHGLRRLLFDLLSFSTPYVVAEVDGNKLQEYHPELERIARRSDEPSAYRPEENQNVLGNPLVIPVDPDDPTAGGKND